MLLLPETDGRVVKILASQMHRLKTSHQVLMLDNDQPSAQLNADLSVEG